MIQPSSVFVWFGLLTLFKYGIVAEEREDPDIRQVLAEKAKFYAKVRLLDRYLTKAMEDAQPGESYDEDTWSMQNGTIPDLSVFRQVFSGYLSDSVRRHAVCSGCQVYIGMIMYQVHTKMATAEQLGNVAIFTCNFFRLAHPDVCQGLISRLVPTIYYIINERKQLTPHGFCGLVFQSIGCSTYKDRYLNWVIDDKLLEGSSNKTKYDLQWAKTVTVNNTKSFKIVHLADLHIDPKYTPGTEAECDNEVLCCQAENGYVDNGAGVWGDNRTCDAPMNMLESALQHIVKEHADAKIIYMTGDLVPHNIWYTSKEENSGVIQDVSLLIQKYFPNSTVVASLGNHEAHPVNLYSPHDVPEDVSTTWLYDVTLDVWRDWIPEGQVDSFLHGGAYAVRISKNFRVLVVNTNVCYGFNFWQMYSPRDPADQITWLALQLRYSEDNNETVHIVGHVPPGHEDCFLAWSREFYKVVARFAHIIKGQFYGHTHYDEFRMYHDPKNKTEYLNTEWIGPSLTPYRIQNPGYRIYYADAETSDIIDHETWIYELDQANKDPEGPKWFKLYTASEAYAMSNVMGPNLQNFVTRMAKEKDVFDLFYQYYFHTSNEAYREECDTLCRKRILCGIVRPYYEEHEECARIQKEVDGIVLPLRILDEKKRRIWL